MELLHTKQVRMKNILIIVIAVLTIAGGLYFFLGSQTATAPTAEVSHLEAEVGAVDEETAATEKNEEAGESKVFTVGGKNFAYDVTEMRVQEGDTVTINFNSISGFHDWVVDEFSAATEKVKPGTPTSVTFVADKAGEYEYYCSVGSHRANGMVGTLIIE